MKEKSKLDVKKIVKQFEKEDSSISGRRGSFKIDVPFEQAMKRILKAKPEPKKKKEANSALEA